MTQYPKYLAGLIKLRWLVILLVVMALYLLEADEHDATGFDLFTVSELPIYFLILPVLGLVFELLARSNQKLNHALEILEQKHRLSTSLALESDWFGLVNHLVQVPSILPGVNESVLLLYNQQQGSYEPVASWVEQGSKQAPAYTNELLLGFEQNPSGSMQPIRCDDGSAAYCLPLSYGHTNIAMLQIRMTARAELNKNQVELLNNLVNEMAAGLVTGQERKTLSDLRAKEAAQAERQNMSRYLHDHISQNLGYLRLKLDQFSSSLLPASSEDLKKDFTQMRIAADESYEIVRSLLESLYRTGSQNLNELINDLTRKLSQRVEFKIKITQRGNSIDLPPETAQLVFFIIREALSNVEKHAEACSVEIALIWQPSGLSVTIADDGKGFAPDGVDANKHFGLEIIQERVAALDGRVEICPSIDHGTAVNFWVPIRIGENA
jgi:signal transduction histidine kinase